MIFLILCFIISVLEYFLEGIMNKLFLYEDFFTKDEKEVVSFGKLSASIFTYSTGVKAVRLRNDRGAIVLLP